MKTTSDYWRNWWNQRAKPGVSDLDIDRGGSHLAPGRRQGVMVNEELERRSRLQLLAALDLKSTDVVLDAGCGTGANFATLSPIVRRIVAIDFSDEQIRRAQRRINSENLPNVELHIGSVTELPFPADAFDKVVCASVLQYLNDEECQVALAEMIRVCKNHGTIIIHAKNRTSLYGIALSLLRWVARITGRKTANDYYRPRRWYGQMLANHGSRVVNFDAFGLFHFPPLPAKVVQHLLRLELRIVKGQFWKQFGVNYKMTVRVEKDRARTVPRG